MRILKQNTLRYETFYKSLQSVKSDSEERLRNSALLKQSTLFPKMVEVSNNLNHFLAFRKNLRSKNSVQEAAELLSNELINSYEFNLAELYLFDETDNKLKPQINSQKAKLHEFIDRIYSEGILDWVFESRQSQVIPDISNKELRSGLKKYLLMPLNFNFKNIGILAIDRKTIDISLSPKDESEILLFTEETYFQIELLNSKKLAKTAYEDLQFYQSKLLNEFKLSSIGELTKSVVQDILSPLQYLVTNIDILRKETNEQETQVFDSMHNQIKRIETVIKRLIKFSELNNDSVKIHPCDLNKLIVDYKNLINSSLEENGIEYILDLSDQLPYILSHPSYILQIFSNLFKIILDDSMKGGGIYLQTRFVNDNIVVRIVLTLSLNSINGNNDVLKVNTNIIKNLMQKHEGSFQIQTDANIGTRITFIFPLKRKFRV